MVKVFNYFNDKNYPIQVTDETCILTKYTFLENNELWENNSLKQFFSQIDKHNNYNIIDIGAQSGLYSLFAKYLPNSKFYSFEPFKPTFKLLNDNIKLNEITNVETFNLAISDNKGISNFNVCLGHNGLHTMGSNPLRFNDIQKIQVETDTIDNLFYEKNIPVHFIKIDTEGFEYFILKGAINTINKYKPIIQLEWNITNMQQCNINPNMLLELFNNLDYIEKCMVEEEKIFGPK